MWKRRDLVPREPSMRPLIRSTLVGTVMLPAVLTISGWAAGAAAASAPPPAITITAGNHGAPSAPASPEPAMLGMDMSGSGAADPTMPWMDMSGADGSGSMPGMDMGTGSPGSVSYTHLTLPTKRIV